MSFEGPLTIELGAGREATLISAFFAGLAAAATLAVAPAWRALPLFALIVALLAPSRTTRGGEWLMLRRGSWTLVAGDRQSAVELVQAAYVQCPLVVLTLRLASGRKRRVVVRPGRLAPEPRRRLRARLRAARMSVSGRHA